MSYVGPMMRAALEASGKWEAFQEQYKFIEESIYESMRKEFDPASIERFASYDNEMPGHVFRYRKEDAFLGRRELSKLFGKKNKRPARECEALETFLYQLLEHNEASLDDMDSVQTFMRRMCLTPRDLQFLWIECGRRGYHNGEGYLPRVEPFNGQWRLAWFIGNSRKTEWQTYNKQYRLLHGMPAFEERPLE